MEDDPDVDAMANRPIVGQADDSEIRETTVIEGGASGGLFVADDDDSDEDATIRHARAEADAEMEGYDSEAYAGQQLMYSEEGSGAEEEDDEEAEEEGPGLGDDPIVKTIDIYATKILSEHLYLFQYPIRPANRPYEETDRPTEARMKPRAGHLQVEIPILESNYYDRQRAVQWTTEPLRTQTLGGSVAPGRNYLVGLVRGDEMHVTPLKGVAQLRPIFRYIDEHDREEREVKRSEASADKTARAPKTVQVSAKSSDMLPDLSTTALIRAAEEENWTKLQWRESTHRESENVSKHLMTGKQDTLCTPITDKAAYLDMLSTTRSADATTKPKPKQESK